MLCFYPLINVELTESRHFSMLAISYRTFISHNIANIFLVSHILLLFHSPKGSWNKSAKYEKLGKYWPYCTRNRAITNAYLKNSLITHQRLLIAKNSFVTSWRRFLSNRNQCIDLHDWFLMKEFRFYWNNSIAAYKYIFEADNKSAPLICWNVTINAPELPRFSTFQCFDC